ncbi:MAG: hypothetical protein GC155_18550 [Alphaproteobacteria bacterium]|nr:hypothetical protein [Alphaproteobacteria bacterium]
MTAKPLRGVHVLFAIVAFFAIDIAVNVLFITRAVSTFPGEETPNSYVQGVDFNSTLAQRKAQAALGWSAEVGVDAVRGRKLVVRMHAAGGAPLSGLVVEARVHRIGKGARGQGLSLTEAASGQYSAPLEVDTPCRLEVEVRAKRGGDEAPVIFVASKTLVLP